MLHSGHIRQFHIEKAGLPQRIDFSDCSITAASLSCCISSCSRAPNAAMTPRWARAIGGKNYMFWKMCLTLCSTKSPVSFLCVAYAKQTASDGGWKSEKATMPTSQSGSGSSTNRNAVMFRVQPEKLSHATGLKKKRKKTPHVSFRDLLMFYFFKDDG